MHKACRRGWVLALVWLQVFQNSGSWMFMLRNKPCQHEIATDKIQETKNHWERTNIPVRVSVHWLAQCHAKWPKGSRYFQHPAGFEPISPNSLWLALTIKPWVRINVQKQTVYDSSYFATLNQVFACRIFILGLLKLNTKIIQNIQELLTANLLLIHVIAFDIYWIEKKFSLHSFCSILIKQLIILENLTGCQFRSAPLHRILFGTWWFAFMPYVYPETNER